MTDTTHVEGTGNDPDNPSPRVGRRALMLGATAAGVGGAASLVAGAGTADAANGGDVLLGKKNTATASTTVTLTGATHSETAVYGVDKTTGNGGGAGVQGTSKNGTGVLGQVGGSTTGQRAVYGIDQSSGGGYGVVGTSDNGTGVYGTGDEYGVYGTSTDGTGVYGTSAGVPGGGVVIAGVYGNATSADGIGVYGEGVAEDGVGVYGLGNVEGGYGVAGYADGEDGIGVWGYAAASGGYGVYARSLTSDSLYVDGSAAVTGSLSKGGGSFKIDHPLDPGGKYLYHSFVESPDMKNVYDGTVTLDGDGRATVELPDWFEALNQDYRYQLTAIGIPAPELHISREVKNGTFSIAGGRADQKVSWQVTGIRQDAWAIANRIPVEVEKPERDQGRYLHPELFGGEAITALAKARAQGHRPRRQVTGR
jgi:hypothetical protein